MQKQGTNRTIYFWILTTLAAFGLLAARVVFPEMLWLSVVCALSLVGGLGGLVFENRKALRTRTAVYGFNSALTIVLVLSIVGVLNFLVSRYPQKADLTKNQRHTLSDQSRKVVKGLKQPVKAVYFSRIDQRDQ